MARARSPRRASAKAEPATQAAPIEGAAAATEAASILFEIADDPIGQVIEEFAALPPSESGEDWLAEMAELHTGATPGEVVPTLELRSNGSAAPASSLEGNANRRRRRRRGAGNRPEGGGRVEGVGRPDDRGRLEGGGRPDGRGRRGGGGRPDDRGQVDAASPPGDRSQLDAAGPPGERSQLDAAGPPDDRSQLDGNGLPDGGKRTDGETRPTPTPPPRAERRPRKGRKRIEPQEIVPLAADGEALIDSLEEPEDLEILQPDAPMDPDTPVAQAARRLGIRRLHPEQKRGIEAALAGRNVLMVLPTGFGKSACYQIPSMLLDRPVVLISPLLALLKDQHEKLIKYDVPCVRLDGTVRGKARVAALARIRKGGALLVMTTPETLGSEEASGALRESGISIAAIDEAHCISEWGYDFRPAYLQIGDRLRALGSPAIMALTATATEKVRSDITRFLGMREAEIVASSPHRSNLAFEVLECREAARARALARLAQRLRRPGIIYCTTTREVDTVYAILTRLGIPAHRYHGKMAAGERNAQQDLFMKPGRRTVMIATNAFGLGIDKPDIRYVVHGQSPASLEQYVQEAGRAGRDGAKANCLLLFDPDDRLTHEALLSRSRLRADQLYRLGSALAAWAAEGRTPTIDALALSAELGERPTNALLVPIEEAEIVRTQDDGTVAALIPAAEIEERVRSLAGQFANLRTQDSRRLDSVADYARTKECRATFLRGYFGEEAGEPCNLCDICRGRPERPSTFWQPVAAPPRPGRKRKRGQRGQQAQPFGRGRGRARGRGGQQQGTRQKPGPGKAQGQQHGRPQPQQHGQQNPPQPGQAPGGGGGGGGRGRRRRGRRRRGGRPNPAPPAPPATT